MEKIYRVFTEKRNGFDVETKNLYADIKAQLNIKSLEGIRILKRYDVSGITDEVFKQAYKTILSEPNADYISFEMPNAKRFVIRELQTGTYDQRADSAEQCIKMLAPDSNPTVKTAVVFIFEGDITDDEYSRLCSYLINPVESKMGEEKLPESLISKADVPMDVETVTEFNSFNEQQMREYIGKMGFAMSLADAMFVQQHFNSIKRSPTITELKVIDTYWSDHCRHTTFMTRLNNISFENDKTGELKKAWDEYMQIRKAVYTEKEKPITLMDLGTIAAKYLRKHGKLDDLDVSEEINACSIRCDVDVDGESVPYLIMFKNETHNHPTEIEPFGGAATCLGGAIRDPLSGRAYVYQAMRVTGAGNPLTPFEDTIPGKLPQSVIVKSAAHGYSSYGNQIGLATGMVDELYHDGYVAKRMEIGAVIAAAPAENVVRICPEAGDVVLLVGGRTGRDGCGGATGSSKSHTDSSLASCGAEVQKGNPITERKIQRLFRNPEVSRLIKRCNDFGAGGVSVAVGELADSLAINLDLVPKKYEGLDGTELAISESQERMAVVVAPYDAEKFMKLSAEENLECTEVAVVTDDGHMTMTWRGKTIVDLERAFLDTNGVISSTDAKPASCIVKYGEKAQNGSKEELISRLGTLNGCSKRGLVERFDSTVGANTVLMPFGGKTQSSPEKVMAAKIPTGAQTNTGTIMSYGFNPYISEQSPYHGAIYAVCESLARLGAAGADTTKARLTFQEYFEKLGKDENKWGKPLSALLGALKAQKNMETAAIGGKDSMSGTFMDISVPPTLVSFAVVTADMRKVVSAVLKGAGHKIVMLKTALDNSAVIDFDSLKNNLKSLNNAINQGKVLSAQTVDMDGIAPTLTRAAFGNTVGLEFEDIELFDAMPCSVLVELDDSVNEKELFMGVDTVLAAHTTASEYIQMGDVKVTLDEAYKAYTNTLEPVFAVGKYDKTDVEAASFRYRNSNRPSVKIAQPRVTIPIFPGTNCEYESIRAFEKAGAVVNSIVIRNTAKGDIQDSIHQLAQLIKNSQIIMLPGGFSSGDEPDGSAKFSATVFRSGEVMDAVHEMLKSRDGLMLGICNGFQTLIKLGLVPYGEIRDTYENAPTLTFNRIGRHQSRIVRTRIASVLSPWFAQVNVNDIISVPISHGEGRVVFPDKDELFKTMASGQIATQYVDLSGNPTMDIDFNPPESELAIEGITSPDGRILGKMGHSERYCDGLYSNIKGNFDSGIFSSGVKYFE